MKKKVLSLISGIISAIVALGLLALTLYCFISMGEVAKIIGDTTDDLWGIQLIAYAGITYVIATLGAIIAGALGCYRGMLAYYYIKIFFSDEAFYAERKGVVGFSVLALPVFTALMTASIERFTFIPENGLMITYALTVLYGLMVVLPLTERAIVAISRRKVKEKATGEEEVPTKQKIVRELDNLAEDAAQNTKEGKE